MSEGFETAKDLSKKFMTLYDLAKNLLSKQMHYDWGLRAVKSVLRQAGGLKRAEPNVPEDAILMRGLRDFNMPKIVVDDRAIFKGLIDNLFPGVVADPKVDENLKNLVSTATKKEGLQAEEGFVLKCVQLAEILVVRHCCFIIGNPGCAKSTIW
jgi:dynein heavy chain